MHRNKPPSPLPSLIKKHKINSLIKTKKERELTINNNKSKRSREKKNLSEEKQEGEEKEKTKEKYSGWFSQYVFARETKKGGGERERARWSEIERKRDANESNFL